MIIDPFTLTCFLILRGDPAKSCPRCHEEMPGYEAAPEFVMAKDMEEALEIARARGPLVRGVIEQGPCHANIRRLPLAGEAEPR